MNLELDRYGLWEGINEVIVTTVSLDGKPNAAPIGIIRHDGKLTVRVYNGSHTYTNIMETGLLAANMVYDPVLFVRCALSDLGEEEFEFIATDDGRIFPVIVDCSAWMLFHLEHTRGENLLVAELKTITCTIRTQEIRPVNRAFNAIIEVVILATRYKVFKMEKYLIEMEAYSNIIYKCGGSIEKKAYELIFRLL
ncbi:MAG: DUF447 family protein [Methanosarcinales archaeon]|nr:DUF447 family protein [Methanosarcinales archaeon]